MVLKSMASQELIQEVQNKTLNQLLNKNTELLTLPRVFICFKFYFLTSISFLPPIYGLKHSGIEIEPSSL